MGDRTDQTERRILLEHRVTGLETELRKAQARAKETETVLYIIDTVYGESVDQLLKDLMRLKSEGETRRRWTVVGMTTLITIGVGAVVSSFWDYLITMFQHIVNSGG